MLRPADKAGFTMIITTCNKRIANAFAARGRFWLNKVPPMNLSINGFEIQPASLPADRRPRGSRLLLRPWSHDGCTVVFATDDWPFLCLPHAARRYPDGRHRANHGLSLSA
jgi:hypothetical protein